MRWIESVNRHQGLGIVLRPVTEDAISVLVADRQGNVDVEVFVARVDDTGVDASELTRESMEVVEGEGDDDLKALLRALAERYEGSGTLVLDQEAIDAIRPEPGRREH